ncbi:glycosyltransferase [Sphingomonas sabuli]|uniref:Glycosyltransferase n=1 Tax=Sphingomonas sabuli TaxID=2764186 RepID=A0A7G9L4S4_9SPHN|nr:glycosyltransferase [Sphingomonas sabuli]QNM83623.1 glycosyltransferase [Sphingomonas sabuli]
MSAAAPLLICDVTQSWSEVGGGVGTYLRRKRDFLLANTPHRHMLIVPGAEDHVEEDGRTITVTIRSPKVPTSPRYRLLLRNGAVREALERFKPDVIESQDAYNLPWAVLGYRRQHPDVAAVAGYFTDFPTAYVQRPFRRVLGNWLANKAQALCYWYCGKLYGRFDAVYALSEAGGADKLRELGVGNVEIVPLGVELDAFTPDKRDPDVRRKLGVEPDQPLLVYLGRLDRERRAQVVVDAFNKLPEALGARLVLLGEGPVRDSIVASGNPRVIAPGYLKDRAELARWLASSDMYVSAMADETFGVSVIEAQASGLPVVGVAAGAMLDRVDEETGRLGPVDDADAMAANILEVWQSNRQAMGAAARQHVEGLFGWDVTFERLLRNVYPKAIAARHSSAPANVGGSVARGTAA